MHGPPGLAVLADEELGPRPFDFEPASHEDVRAAHRPDDRARLALLGRQAVRSHRDVLDRGGPFAPHVLGEVRPILPQAVVDRVFVRRGRPPRTVILERADLPPAPDERLAGTQDHVHRGVRLVPALAPDRSLEEVHGAHLRVGPPGIRKEDSLGVGPLDQVVVAHDVLLAGHGLVVPQEVDGVHVAVVEVPAAVVEGLGDAVAQGPGRRRLESGLAPQGGQADGVVAAGVVAVDVEDLHRVAQLVVVARRNGGGTGSPGTRGQTPSPRRSCPA